MNTCRVVELGVMRYGEAWVLQQKLAAARKQDSAPDVLLLCEHPHVITLGRNGKRQHLLASHQILRQMGVEFHQTNRGGDITYHGPGQVVGYPIIQLGQIRRDVGWYVRQLEETMIQVTASFGIEAFRVPGCTGVWAGAAADARVAAAMPEPAAKLGAIGVHLSRWVTTHGFAYNVAPDLHYFDLIVPCGIAGCRSISLQKLLGRHVDPSDVRPRIVASFGDALGMNMVPANREDLDEWAAAVPEMGHVQVANG